MGLVVACRLRDSCPHVNDVGFARALESMCRTTIMVSLSAIVCMICGGASWKQAGLSLRRSLRQIRVEMSTLGGGHDSRDPAAVAAAAKAVRQLSKLPSKSSRQPTLAVKQVPARSASSAERYWAIMAAYKQQGGPLGESCPRCWLRLEACVCDSMGEASEAPIDVVICVHHREWGRASNSATVLGAKVSNCRLLMKGVDDEEINAILEERECAILWPAEGAGSCTITAQECVDQGRVLLVPDGSWQSARRVLKALPSDLPRLSLPVDAVRAEVDRVGLDYDANSLLAPLRATNRKRAIARVCTCQATVAALRAMGHTHDACDHVLFALRHKVTVLAAIRGSRTVDPKFV